MDAELQYIELAKVLGPTAIAVLGTLAGGFIGHKYAKVQTRTSKSIEFTERRIQEFYSPMVGCLQRVRALADLRSEISAGASTAWKKICDAHPRPFVDHEEYFAPFKASIDFDNQQLVVEKPIAIFLRQFLKLLSSPCGQVCALDRDACARFRLIGVR